MSRGALALVLHAHLPFVRRPEEPGPRRDDWFLEAFIESYLPLLSAWRRLSAEGVAFRLALSLSPTLLSMLLDPWLRSRAARHLDSLMELAEREVERTRGAPEFHGTALFYRERIEHLRRFHAEDCRGDLLAAVRELERAGRIEVVTTAATHGFLPALLPNRSAVRSQIEVGLDLFTRVFGRPPSGFWLPECGYHPGIEEDLERHGVRWFVVESDAVLRGHPSPPQGVHAPVATPLGVAAFARDPDAARQVWSNWLGYPGDPDYREFYRDIGWDLEREYLAPWLPTDGSRKDTGFKYHRVTGQGDRKEPYVREWAIEKAARHAQHFLDERKAAVLTLPAPPDRPPIVVAPFDAELFGHWWFEGPEWLDFLVRKTVFDQDTIELLTPSDYLDRHPTLPMVELAPSTWGRRGTNEVWVNEANDGIYRHLHRASRRMSQLVRGAPYDSELLDRALRQAGRELLLAQASDWPFQMASEDTAAYGRERFREHMLHFLGLERQIEARRVDSAWLAELEARDNLFPDLEPERFA